MADGKVGIYSRIFAAYRGAEPRARVEEAFEAGG